MEGHKFSEAAALWSVILVACLAQRWVMSRINKIIGSVILVASLARQWLANEPAHQWSLQLWP